MIEAKIIRYSSVNHNSLVTFQLKYPLAIHGELMTHRVFSRNARSSRAVPTRVLIEEVLNDPWVPEFIGANKPGMQAGEELTEAAKDCIKKEWLIASKQACDRAQRIAEMGAHKQIVNRILAPYQWMHTVVSSTEWDNFFELRLHKDAEPHMGKLARLMFEAIRNSRPTIPWSGWHLPYINAYEKANRMLVDNIKSSIARCARVSYKIFEADRAPTLQEDIRLYEKLVGSRPMHASPTEHVAFYDLEGDHPKQWGNFRNWRQFRKMLEQSPDGIFASF